MDRQSRWSEKQLAIQLVQPEWVFKAGFHAGKGLVGATVSPGHKLDMEMSEIKADEMF